MDLGISIQAAVDQLEAAWLAQDGPKVAEAMRRIKELSPTIAETVADILIKKGIPRKVLLPDE